MGKCTSEFHPAGDSVPGAAGLDQEHHLRKLCRKGAARNERAVVTPLLTREQVIRAQGEELAVKAGGMAPFLNAFFSGRKLTMEEALELKDLIDQHTWED